MSGHSCNGSEHTYALITITYACCTEDLVDHCQAIAAAAPNTPMYYYHFPGRSGVNSKLIKRFPAQSSIRLIFLNKCTTQNREYRVTAASKQHVQKMLRSQVIYSLLTMCMCVCVCARARACVCVCVCVCP